MATLTSEIASASPQGAKRALRAVATSGAGALSGAPGAGVRLPDRLLRVSRRGDADAARSTIRPGAGRTSSRYSGHAAASTSSAVRCRRMPISGSSDHLTDSGRRDSLHTAARLPGRLRPVVALGLPGEPAHDPGADPVLDEHSGPLVCLDGAARARGNHQRGIDRQPVSAPSRCNCSTPASPSTSA